MAKHELTLRRAHAVAKRLEAHIAELSSQATKLGESVTLQGYAEGQIGRLRENGAKVMKLLDDQSLAIAALAAIRDAVGRANTEHGINERLARFNANKKLLACLDDLVEGQEENVRGSLLRLDEIKGYQPVGQGESLSRTANSVRVSVFSDEHVADLRKRQQSLKRANAVLEDEIAELNGRKVTVEIDDAIARVLVLQD